jgi:hypothetical protein
MVVNKKINVTKILVEQIRVFKNFKTGKTSFWDIISFIAYLFLLSSCLVLLFNFDISDDMSAILTSVFSLVFTILFAFAEILISKKDSDKRIEKQIVNETFVSIITSSILSLFSVILLIAEMNICLPLLSEIITVLILSLAIITTMLLLLIIKRTFIIYMDGNSEK